jgi:ubiquinone/menaquinone biosynthesis C-methylase UbiE
MSHLSHLQALVPLPGTIAVDVGCGTGALVRALAQAGAEAIGIEAHDPPLHAARSHPPVNGERYLKGTGEALPLPDGSADVVTFIFSLHHVPVAHQRQALAEARRVLKPGGRIHVAEPLVDGAYFQLLRWVDDETEVRRAAQDALADAESLGLRRVADELYDHVEEFADFEDFKRRAVLVDAARTSALSRVEPHARHAFHAHGEVTAQGVRFIQPVRLVHFQA